MNNFLSGYRNLSLFITLTVNLFFFLVGGTYIFWLLIRTAGFSTDFWVMTEALSLAVAAAAGLSAGFVAYRELSEAASSRHMDIANRLFEELNSPENIAARRWIFKNLRDNPEEEVGTMADEGRAAIKQVLNSLDQVAFLTQSGWIPDEIIMPWMYPMIAKSWKKLEPYVNYEKQRRKEPYYYQCVGELAKRCHAWRVKNVPDWEIIWIEDAL